MSLVAAATQIVNLEKQTADLKASAENAAKAHQDSLEPLKSAWDAFDAALKEVQDASAVRGKPASE